VARAFAREGAGVFLAGRTEAKLDPVAAGIQRATPAQQSGDAGRRGNVAAFVASDLARTMTANRSQHLPAARLMD